MTSKHLSMSILLVMFEFLSRDSVGRKVFHVKQHAEAEMGPILRETTHPRNLVECFQATIILPRALLRSLSRALFRPGTRWTDVRRHRGHFRQRIKEAVGCRSARC